MDFSSLTNHDLLVLNAMSLEENIFLDAFSQVLTSGWTWLPLYIMMLFTVIKNNETMAQILLVISSAALCILFAGGVSDIIVKPLTMRLRPLNDPYISGITDIVEGVSNASYSFFSSHAANTMSIAVFFSLLFRNRLCSLTLIVWSLTNSWTRIHLAMHYPSDVAVGLLWGATVGTVMFLLYHHMYYRITPHLHFISSQYTRTGYALKDVTWITNIFYISVILSLFLALLIVA